MTYEELVTETAEAMFHAYYGADSKKIMYHRETYELLARAAIATIREVLEPVAYRYYAVGEGWLLCGTDPTDLCDKDDDYHSPERLYDASPLSPKG